jgi:Asp-tRNA(Asn)/Glu-tRNA(Gln) amidotransferase A subunit family amidase
MPVAMQLIGKPGGEAQLFRHIAAIEAMTDWSSHPVNPFAENNVSVLT